MDARGGRGTDHEMEVGSVEVAGLAEEFDDVGVAHDGGYSMPRRSRRNSLGRAL